MATSGSTNFTQTRNEIISDVLTDLGVVRPGGTVNSNDYTYCANRLNKMVKAWQAQGIHMWKETEGTLFLQNGINKYILSTTSTDLAGDDVVETVLTADASGTSLTVDDTTGMTTGDVVVLALDDNTLHSSTVTVNSTTSLTMADAIASASTSGNRVATYTTHVSKPLHISSFRFNNSDGTDRPVYPRGRDEFMVIPNKEITGKVNQAFFTPKIDNGIVYVWPTPDYVQDRVRFSYVKMLEDFDSSSDNPDFPSEWLDCIHDNLKYRVAKTYGKDAQDRELMRLDAQQSLLEMQLWDAGQGSTRIVPNYRDDC
jgi:hypothetical protein